VIKDNDTQSFSCYGEGKYRDKASEQSTNKGKKLLEEQRRGGVKH